MESSNLPSLGANITTSDSHELALLIRYQSQLMEIQDLPELREIRDKSRAIRQYQRTRGESKRSQNLCGKIAALAEARIGQELIHGKASGAIASQGRPKETLIDEPFSTLDVLGIERPESYRVQLAAAVLEEAPEWFDEYLQECNEAGRDFTQQAVIRKGKEIRNAKVGKRKVATPCGKYDVIVIDPPWPMEKIEREVTPNQAGFDYPTMSEDELSALEIPAADDCHLWIWTTHKFLPMALRLAPVWGFKYCCTFTWHKAGGFQPFGLPQYNSEHALYCRRGSPKFSTTKAFPVCFNAPRGEHSEKPEAFYDMLRRVTDGERLDMFSRRTIAGFTNWGNEAPGAKSHGNREADE